MYRRLKEITLEEESRIVTLRKQHICWGKVKIKKLYETTYGTTISSWKVHYTIQKYRLYLKPKKHKHTQVKRKRNKAKKRTKDLTRKPHPSFLIALDTIVVHWRVWKRSILTAIDTVSKIAFARMYTTKHSYNATEFIEQVAYLF